MGLLDRFRRRSAPPASAASDGSGRTHPPDDAPTAAALLDEARRIVHPGFHTRAQARQAARDAFDDRAAGTVDAAERVVDQVWQERLAEQATWPSTTDSDRLDRVFNRLELEGVVARMSFTCCQACGCAEVGDEVQPGQERHGYVFFHSQDAEGLIDPDAALLLTYGALEAADEEVWQATSLAVGEQVVAALRAEGLTVHWDGRLEQRIQVQGLDWRRPLPS
ncbi:DUF6891 domain-containing protein [Motilibacter aurantiacus]|uniref:DUF6891 domain-containing protein n=1 Tax=Motilibacter aurantiacus TaxID=2714955 RepID=UPI001407E31E|nr:hypothetical protein [Motilibacter aurantiacus]NHC46979.1 hypothetical protein [Motilibacter aurantiacus]